jgi:crotonobetainyl-CoA:carnitine CoA-transferase CaiB-like acyl-CoA transferase
MNEEEKCQGPLSGYRILEMSTLVAASICGMLLADMGAEVIKVEPPRKGDFARSMGTAFHGGESLMFLSMNRNKLSLMVDLEKEEGRKIFYRLLPTVDAVIEGFRPSLAGGLQMDYEACRKVREDIIYPSRANWAAPQGWRVIQPLILQGPPWGSTHFALLSSTESAQGRGSRSRYPSWIAWFIP